MAKRYTCHLFFVELPDGMIEVTYEEPAEGVIGRPVDFIGPEPLEVPEFPQTQYQHHDWLMSVLQPNGPYIMSFSYRSAGPPIEEEEVPDSPPDGLIIEAHLHAYQRPGQSRTLLVAVKNAGDVPIPELSVHWVFGNETPQQVQVGGIPAQDLGGSLSLMRPSAFNGPLAAGRKVSFLLDERALHPLLGQVAALSPERYWIAIMSGRFEIHRIEGNIAGEFLEKLEEMPMTYEFSLADERSGEEDPDELLNGFAGIKEREPSVQLLTITIPCTERGMEVGAFIHGFSSYTGKVNATEFEGREPGTVMFFGSKSSSGNPVAKLVFLHRPEGWNKEFNEGTGRWEEIVFTATGKPRYETVDFTPLAAMRIKGWH